MSFPRTALLIVLVLVGLGLSGILMLQHHGEAPGLVSAANQLCGEEIDEATGCDTVAAGPYSAMFGISLAAAGLFFYVSLALLLALTALAGPEARRAGGALVLVLVGLALVIDVMLLGVQAFVIHRFCNLCLLTYLVNAALLVLLLPTRRDLGAVWQTLGQAHGRLALSSWVLGSVAFALAIGAGDQVLAYRAKQRVTNLLGVLPAAPAPAVRPATETDATQAEQALETGETGATGEPAAPVAEGDLETALEQARAEAQRLQGILDDPQKLQQYLNDKAWKEYENAPVLPIKTQGLPVKGPEDAPISVVEYSDFLCPFCRNIAHAFNDFVPKTQGLVSLRYKHYPLDNECNQELNGSLHPGACELALGAVCAQDQGNEGFWKFHDKVYSKQLREISRDDTVGLAAEAGLDFMALKRCMESPEAAAALAEQIAEGRKLGVMATPSIFINGKKLPRVNDFVQAVNAEAERLGLEPLSAQATE